MSVFSVPVFLRTALLCGVMGLAACSVAPPGAAIHDPFEASNRQVHAFNKGLDRAVLRPAGQAAAAAPEPLRDGVVNFAENVALPGMVLNGLLQGRLDGPAVNTMRFVINSTVGLLGFFDPADAIGLYAQRTDFGETLAVWRVPQGAYVELPVFGPSTQRDAAGLFVDFIIDPLSRVGTSEQATYGVTSRVADLVIYRGVFGDTLDSVLYESADSYAQSRLIYLQSRRFQLGQGADDGYVDPYDDFIDPYEDFE